MSRHRINLESLTPQGFVSFGAVIENPASSGYAIPEIAANQGTAKKYANISPLENHYHLSKSKTNGKPAVSMFICSPRRLRRHRDERLIDITILERHPYTTQTFVPLGVTRDGSKSQYLVVVAPTLGQMADGPPDLNNLRGFLANGNQAITYGAGTWHAPMIVIGSQPIDFVVTQFVNGIAADDCQEIEIPAYSVLVELAKHAKL